MIRYLLLLLSSISIAAQAQQIQNVYPHVGSPLDFGPEVQKKWALRDKIMEDLSTGAKQWDKLTPEEKTVVDELGEIYESMWDIIGDGCSWYCGGGPKVVTASSYLKSQGNNSYAPDNAHDLSYETAWVEGVPGYGVGEFLLYTFNGKSPRIDEIIIVNGYVKSEAAWKNNSRVKKIRMTVDGKPYAILNLEDSRTTQYFKIEPLGNDPDKWIKSVSLPDWIVKFEILEVYKGDKYDDTAITEIYFNGLDVHCLAKGTKITMADNTERNIESLRVGDRVMSYNKQIDSFEPAEILELASPVHEHLVTITFTDGTSLTSTADHPFFDGEHWRSFDPEKTRRDYRYDEVLPLMTGQILKTVDGSKKIKLVQTNHAPQQTYTIVRMIRNDIFIANGVLVGTEEQRVIFPTRGKCLTSN